MSSLTLVTDQSLDLCQKVIITLNVVVAGNKHLKGLSDPAKWKF